MHAPLRADYRTEWRPLAALRPLADEWRELAERAIEPNVFYDPDFALAAEPVLGKGAGAVLVRSAMGRLVGLFPARRAFGRGLVGWTHPFAPLGVPLVGGDDPQAVIAAWLQHFARDTGGPATVLLPLIPEGGAFSAALDAVLAAQQRPHAGFGRHERALLSPDTGRQGYLDRALSAGKRKELRRQRRRLEEIAPVTFATAGSPGEIGAALKDFLVLEASGWKGIAGTAIVNDPAVKVFVQGAVTALAAHGRARIDRLFLNGTAVAATVTLLSGGTAWCWKIAYSEGLSRFSPGVQLVCDLTDSLLAASMPKRADSCAKPDHPMIGHVWRERLALSDRMIALRGPALCFALARAAESARRSVIAAAKDVRGRLRR